MKTPESPKSNIARSNVSRTFISLAVDARPRPDLHDAPIDPFRLMRNLLAQTRDEFESLTTLPAIRRYGPVAAGLAATGWVALVGHSYQAELLALSVAAVVLGAWLSGRAPSGGYEGVLESIERRVEERTRARPGPPDRRRAAICRSGTPTDFSARIWTSPCRS